MEQINALLQTYKYPLLAALVGSVLLFSGATSSIFSSAVNSSAPQSSTLPTESLVTETSELLKVDIAGAVNKPGVYELNKENRVEDLIKAAGGFNDDVNTEYVSKNLNLSQKISDGQKLYIPFKGESFSSGTNTTGIDVNSDTKSKISLNSSSSSELESLPGVGPSTASKIIASRPYQSINDLLTKKVLGKATFEKIKDQIAI